MLHVALEVPLAFLALTRLLQCDDPCASRVEVLGEPLDGPALARGVAALEHDDEPPAGALDPVLELQQLDLQEPLLHLVLVDVQPCRVRISLTPRVNRPPAVIEQDRVVVLRVKHGVVTEPVDVDAGGRPEVSAHAWSPDDLRPMRQLVTE